MPDSPERRWRGSPREWPVLQGMLPVERSRVPAEVLAGLTLAALGIPAVLGYAKNAGIPLVSGLNTMLLPMAAYASSVHPATSWWPRIPRPRSPSPPRSPAWR
jgi:hypothetical protein